MWKATKKFNNIPDNIPPIRNQYKSWSRTDEETAETYAKYLSNNFQSFSTEILQMEEAYFSIHHFK